jgi:hypothetical protein
MAMRERIRDWWEAWGAMVALEAQGERMRADMGLGGLTRRALRARVRGDVPADEGDSCRDGALPPVRLALGAHLR